VALLPGTRLGPYEIVAPLGAGGMGEVFRARDTRLDRTVAIKILAASLASDSLLRERFDREARALSSLNHPHICTLFDVGHQDAAGESGQAIDFLVLEYLDGETLAERLARSSPGGTAIAERATELTQTPGGAAGGLDANVALKIAIDVCDALDKAHRFGIVHRDLKPANVFLVRSGGVSAPPIVKLLDFGLAKSAAPVVGTSGLSMLPTTPPNLTAQGTILGTFQYMAPEQIEGLEADARTDIFAFGAVLFEMLTGRKAFEGKTHARLLGAILKDDPPALSTLQPRTPPALDRIIQVCLAKDPDDRYQSARDLMRDLTWVASGATEPAHAVPTAVPVRPSRLPWIVAAVATLAVIATTAHALRRTATDDAAAGPVQFTLAPPPGTIIAGPRSGGSGLATQVAVSPDGRYLAFVAGADTHYRIWLRPLAAQAAAPVPGTDGGTFPFWSPDSRFIAFFADDKLKKAPISGGPATVLCEAPLGRGGSWNRDNVILFSTDVGYSGMLDGKNRGLMRVSSAGGSPIVVTAIDPQSGETSHRWPHFLPDGRHFLYTASSGPCCPAARRSSIRIGSLDSAETTTLFETESSVSYVSGHLLFARDQTLMAQPFDPQTRQPHGEAFPIGENVSTEGSRYVGASASQNGTLVYGHSTPPSSLRLTWFDRTGKVLSTMGDSSPYFNVALSPDERQVAVGLGLDVGSPDNRDIWMFDIARSVRSRLTANPEVDQSPVWSPDGARIAYGVQHAGKVTLRVSSTVGSGPGETLLEVTGIASRPCDSIRRCSLMPTSWSPDGRYIAYTLAGAFPRNSDVWVLPLFGDRKPIPILETEFNESAAVFSPDGRWIAYTSDESGVPNVYAQPFPGGGRKVRVSTNGGTQPDWRGDGRELFYLGGDRTLTSVAVQATTEFAVGLPQVLFTTVAATYNIGKVYAATKDGQRFLVNTLPPQASESLLTVIVNWPATIQK
jgi:serine/threonine protein kinase/Tol biopolymer transport system component